jgi:hypothetical protein
MILWKFVVCLANRTPHSHQRHVGRPCGDYDNELILAECIMTTYFSDIECDVRCLTVVRGSRTGDDDRVREEAETVKIEIVTGKPRVKLVHTYLGLRLFFNHHSSFYGWPNSEIRCQFSPLSQIIWLRRRSSQWERH